MSFIEKFNVNGKDIDISSTILDMKDSDSSNIDFDISNESNDVLVRFENGHIRTKNFNSSNGLQIKSDGNYISQSTTDGKTKIQKQYKETLQPNIEYVNPLVYCSSNGSISSYNPTNNKYAAAFIDVNSTYTLTIPYLKGISLDASDAAYTSQKTGDYPVTLGLYDSSKGFIGTLDSTISEQTNKTIDFRNPLLISDSFNSTSNYILSDNTSYYLYIQTEAKSSSISSSLSSEDCINICKSQINNISITHYYTHDIQALDKELIDVQDDDIFDFSIKDNNERYVAIINNGDIITKNFNSKQTKDAITSLQSANINTDYFIPKGSNTLGSYTSTIIPTGYITTQGICTQYLVRMNQNQILTNLHFYASKSGKIHFGIGTIDQRLWAIISKEFDVNCNAGVNDIDITNLCILGIRNGYLFVYNNYYGDGCCIGYIKRTFASESVLYNSDTVNGALSEYTNENMTYGADLALSYKQSSSQMLYQFRIKSETDEDDLTQIINKVGYIHNNIGNFRGSDGKYYTLDVFNGNVSAKEISYSKITIFGNSIFTHGTISSWLYPITDSSNNVWNYTGEADSDNAIGMNGRAMGATLQDFDFKHLFRKKLREKYPNIVVQGNNIAGIERNLPNDFGNTNLLTSDVDVIIWRCGENVAAGKIQYAEALRRYVEYFQSRCPKAKIIMTGRFWLSKDSDNAVKEVCNEYNLPYIDMYLPGNYQARSYDVVKLPMVNSSTNAVEEKYELVNGGAGHPSNLGYYEIANRLLLSLNEKPLLILHNVYVQNSGNYSITYRQSCLEGELYTLTINSVSINSISVKDANNTDIDYQILTNADISIMSKSISNLIFTAPASDVTVLLK